MKLLFWNIGPSPDKTQNDFVDQAIKEIDPDVFCISEGTPSGAECAVRVAGFNALGYKTIYEPNFHNGSIVKDQYGFNKNGLKVFKRNNVKSIKSFAFGDQDIEGRVLRCRFKFNTETYSCFFIHNMSKAGDERSQSFFLIKLNMLLRSHRRNNPDDKFIICGDFNLFPWENLVRRRETIKSYFYEKENSFFNAKLKKEKYYNPFFEYCLKHKNNLLFATYHGKRHSALIDFALFEGGMKNYDVDIIDTLNKGALLSSKGKKITIRERFDHLPILITLK